MKRGLSAKFPLDRSHTEFSLDRSHTVSVLCKTSDLRTFQNTLLNTAKMRVFWTDLKRFKRPLMPLKKSVPPKETDFFNHF